MVREAEVKHIMNPFDFISLHKNKFGRKNIHALLCITNETNQSHTSSSYFTPG